VEPGEICCPKDSNGGEEAHELPIPSEYRRRYRSGSLPKSLGGWVIILIGPVIIFVIVLIACCCKYAQSKSQRRIDEHERIIGIQIIYFIPIFTLNLIFS